VAVGAFVDCRLLPLTFIDKSRENGVVTAFESELPLALAPVEVNLMHQGQRMDSIASVLVLVEPSNCCCCFVIVGSGYGSHGLKGRIWGFDPQVRSGILSFGFVKLIRVWIDIDIQWWWRWFWVVAVRGDNYGLIVIVAIAFWWLLLMVNQIIARRFLLLLCAIINPEETIECGCRRQDVYGIRTSILTGCICICICMCILVRGRLMCRLHHRVLPPL
jgi:hypothetical protein